MVSALDVANYFLIKVDRKSGDLITQLKLYKLVYYAQAWNLALNSEVLFDGEIQAWQHGPVPVSIRPCFCEYSNNPIPEPAISREEIFDSLSMSYELIDWVWQCYGIYSATYLRNLTHAEYPWINARGELAPDSRSTNPISLQDMHDYYSCIKAMFPENTLVPNRVASLDKPRTIESMQALNFTSFDNALKDLEISLSASDADKAVNLDKYDILVDKIAAKARCHQTDGDEVPEKLIEALASYRD
ncbi:MAG: type II toxin-antitoxin system antitoxin SocA domain-containing protein [Cyanobacteria bacterium P01_E01_bin.6]